MKTVLGDIWAISTPVDAIVVPVNVGWRRSGDAVMGRGLAANAAHRWPWLRQAWGDYCQKVRGDAVPAAFRVESRWCRSLVLFPTKPLNEEKPWLSWQGGAVLEYIEGHLKGLERLVCEFVYNDGKSLGSRVLVPLLGCGNGGLDPSVVRPLMDKQLTHPSFCLVSPPGFIEVKEPTDGSQEPVTGGRRAD